MDRLAKLHGLVSHAIDRLRERLALQDSRLKHRGSFSLVGAESEMELKKLLVASAGFKPLFSTDNIFQLGIGAI